MVDSPKVSITPLNESNYLNWKCRMELYLEKEGLLKVIDEAKPDPVTEDWKKKDKDARVAIGLLVGDSQLYLVRNSKSAKESWDSIKNHHMKNTISNRVRIIRKICSTKMEENGDLEDHLRKMKDLFQLLNEVGEERISELWNVSFVLG